MTARSRESNRFRNLNLCYSLLIKHRSTDWPPFIRNNAELHQFSSILAWIIINQHERNLSFCFKIRGKSRGSAIQGFTARKFGHSLTVSKFIPDILAKRLEWSPWSVTTTACTPRLFSSLLWLESAISEISYACKQSIDWRNSRPRHW